MPLHRPGQEQRKQSAERKMTDSALQWFVISGANGG